MVVNGIVFGINVIGPVTTAQLKRFAEVAETVSVLRKQLTELFNEEFAEMIVSRLGKSSALLEEGSFPKELEAEMERLCALGLVHKARE